MHSIAKFCILEDMATKAKGMALEDRINKINLRYRKNNQALIVKKSTPMKVTGRGLVFAQSTVDYSGLYKNAAGISIPIAFDAKETKNKTSFPLANIEDHQILFLDFWARLGGDSFFLIHFTTPDKVYKVPIDFVLDIIAANKRKSIPIEDLKNEWLVDIDDYLGLDK